MICECECLWMQGGQLSLASCTVTSATGAGIGTEGGQLVVRDSTISNNRGNGVVCVADLSGNPSSCLVNGSRVVRNALNGILVREDSRLLIRNSAVSYNKLYGLLVKVSSFWWELGVSSRDQETWKTGLYIARTNFLQHILARSALGRDVSICLDQVDVLQMAGSQLVLYNTWYR